ncbi:hypothetical protein [Sphingopyxis sp. PET50]|uniref:hypothetical protein n=1 Tax=Sphingopyxis sp. PET50 TaxID=2976533 RepID=UPI0021AF3A3B|nr:hypothetical protein [Sphingopyxis sp. PET50]
MTDIGTSAVSISISKAASPQPAKSCKSLDSLLASFAIGQGFWLAGRVCFLDHVDHQCLLTFPQADVMHGVHSGAEVGATSSNWRRELTMRDRQLLHGAENLAIIGRGADLKASEVDDIFD